MKLDEQWQRLWTERARQHGAETVEAVRQFEADVRMPDRLSVWQCKTCFYLQGGTVSGQAFTGWQCGICGQEQNHPNTATPKVCDPCAQQHSLCTECGGDLNMNTKRRNWAVPK